MNKPELNEAQKIWTEVAQHKAPGNLTAEIAEIEVYKRVLDLFQVGDYYYFIFNLADTRVEFCSDSVYRVLGYTPGQITLDFLFGNIHPDDVSYFLDFESTVTGFFNQLPIDKIMKYKVSYDYRIRNSAGKYVRILQQAMTVQSDQDGALFRTLVIHTDISGLKRSNKMLLSFIGLENEPSYMDVQPVRKFIPAKEIFTRREKEILHLMALNIPSSGIADALHLSINTVGTHRKNMFRKAKVHSALELITLALEKGWI